MKFSFFSVIIAGLTLIPFSAGAQYRDTKNQEETPKTEAQMLLEKVDSSEVPVIITLDDALKIALSENVAVKVADLEIKRSEYAKKGAYAALFPQIDVTGSYQRTIKKQVMYMTMGGQSMGIEVGKSNTINAGASAAMPLVNAQLWGSLKLSALDVELSVEKARSSRLDMVTQVKNAYFGTLFAKEAFHVYKQVYENAVQNLEEAQKKYDAQKVSEFELVRAKMCQFAEAELVITDRLHGMIFSAITETPCIVLGNHNHKIEGSYQWIKHLPYIRFIKEVNNIENHIAELRTLKDCKFENGEILKKFNRMKEIVNESK